MCIKHFSDTKMHIIIFKEMSQISLVDQGTISLSIILSQSEFNKNKKFVLVSSSLWEKRLLQNFSHIMTAVLYILEYSKFHLYYWGRDRKETLIDWYFYFGHITVSVMVHPLLTDICISHVVNFYWKDIYVYTEANTYCFPCLCRTSWNEIHFRC